MTTTEQSEMERSVRDRAPEEAVLRAAAAIVDAEAERAAWGPGVPRLLVVANRTSATPTVLQEVQRWAEAGPCAFALLIPRAPDRAPDWTLEVGLRLLSRAAPARRVEGLPCGPDAFGAIERAVRERRVDHIIVSTRPERLPRLLHRDLPRRVEQLGLPTTLILPRRETRSSARAPWGR
jgi:hypothetical protein